MEVALLLKSTAKPKNMQFSAGSLAVRYATIKSSCILGRKPTFVEKELSESSFFEQLLASQAPKSSGVWAFTARLLGLVLYSSTAYKLICS